MKRKIYILSLLFFWGCAATKTKDNKHHIVFSKRKIGVRTVYSITSPMKVDLIILKSGGHGHGFTLLHSNSEEIYYTNDYGTTSPNYFNYETIGWKGYKFMSEKDTILYGQQTDGRYWKEIKKGADHIGYLNVTKKDTAAFDLALRSLKKK